MNDLRCLLLVEDTEADRYLATRVVRKVWPDAQVIEAHDGKAAIELLEGREPSAMPDVILLDINMPRMNGHEFLETWYAGRGLDVPVVVVLTSSGQLEDRERTARFGCVRDYVVKPLGRDAVSRLPNLLPA